MAQYKNDDRDRRFRLLKLSSWPNIGFLEGHGDEAPGWFGARSPRSVAASGDAGFWDNVIWLPGLDGKARPIEPGIEPLAHGVPNYVGQLRAYGNAIVPQLAAAFIRSVME